MGRRSRSWALWGALVLGLGLAAAPLAFQMFSRAPEGGTMIDDFEPYMSTEVIDRFRGYLAEVDAADAQADQQLRGDLEQTEALGPDSYDTALGGVATLHQTWPDIRADMTDLLDRMEANLDNYEAVAALPPFPLFPWFFVVPGLLIAATAAGVLWARHRGRPARAGRWVLVGLGVGVALAPVAFQMFTRAPQGADMIDDFRPMMTRQRVQAVQGYFITMGVAEGQLRTVALPAATDAGLDPADYAAVAQFSADWPDIVGDFNPMVATMSDNVDNFAAVDALPSFALFPWFFLVPGLLVAGCGLLASGDEPSTPDDTPNPPPEGDVP